MGDLVDIETFGFRFKVVEPASIGYPQHSIGEFTDHEPVLERWCRGIKPGDVVVDAGAQFGSYTMPALAAGASVVAYEPYPDGQAILCANVEANGWTERFSLRPQCLWDGTEYPEKLARQVFGQHYPTNIEGGVLTCRLDDNLAGKVDHIKLDIEGAELGALKGAQRILREYHPRLVVELHEGVSPDPEDEVSRYPETVNANAEIARMLEGLGYALEYVKWDVSRLYLVAEFKVGGER